MNNHETDNTSQVFLQQIAHQLPKVVRVLGMALGVIIIVFAGVGVTILVTDVSADQLTRDPLSEAGLEFYIGFVSNIGLMIWTATVTICLLMAGLLWRNRPKQARFFLASSGVSFMLLFDDAFLLHENVYPRLFDIPEVAVYVGYGFVILGYLVYFRNDILATDFVLLIMALLAFGISLTVDFLEHESVVLSFTEDVFKFTGVVLWLSYFTHTSFQILTKYISD